MLPNGRSGARTIDRTTVEQFGLVTMRPFQPRASGWAASSASRRADSAAGCTGARGGAAIAAAGLLGATRKVLTRGFVSGD